MKYMFIALSVVLMLTGSISTASPLYCDALANPDLLPKKYAKRGPFHVDTSTGWIIGQDQLKDDFSVSEEAEALWREIVAAFTDKGITLAALIAPPRPLFAPDRAKSLGYDAAQAREGFAAYIDALNKAGIIVPDLSEHAFEGDQSEFYFARDTHWTPKGAALSAAYLAQKITGRPPSGTLATVPFTDMYTEKGSLSTVVEKVCGLRPNAEKVEAPIYTKQGNASDLLTDKTDPAIALIGTSFSRRYKHDAYQVANAIAHAFDAPVGNYSVIGGKLTGAMGAFISSGKLDSNKYNMVVWETPYTTLLTNVSGLRQVLGGLHAQGSKRALFTGDLKPSWTTVNHSFTISSHHVLSIHTPDISSGQLEVELYGSQGQKARFKLIKSQRVPTDRRTDIWYMSLARMPFDDVEKLKVKLKQDAKNITIHLID